MKEIVNPEKISYPQKCQIGVIVQIPRDKTYLFDSFEMTLPKEVKEGRIENLEINEDMISFTLVKENEIYSIPESIFGISDYFQPSPETYKFLIRIRTSIENYRESVLICGKSSGLEIPPHQDNDNQCFWNIFDECYLLEKIDNEVKIFRLKIKLIYDNLNRVKGIRIISQPLSKNDSEISNHKNLIQTIQDFQEGKFRQGGDQ
ncbi:MAG: hypothetical protein NZ866_01965 [Patescibacteria group bacterium]|nr:hypothetical protein [Patescibacteria group bacterium]